LAGRGPAHGDEDLAVLKAYRAELLEAQARLCGQYGSDEGHVERGNLFLTPLPQYAS